MTKIGSIWLSDGAVMSAGNSAAAQAAAAHAAAAQHAAAVHAAWVHAAAMAAPAHVAGGAGAAAAAHVGAQAALTAIGTGVFAVGAAAGAVLITRAAMRGMVTFSERLEADATTWLEAYDSNEGWNEAVLAVAARNARIRVLGAQLRNTDGTGDDGDLPDPISPAARSVPDLRRWCEGTDQRLRLAEQKLAARASEAALRTLAQMPGGTGLVAYVPPLVDLQPCYAAAQPPPARPADEAAHAELAARTDFGVTAELGRLPSDVDADDYRRVLHAAAQARKVAATGKATLADVWQQDLHVLVATARENAELRRAETLDAARYLETLDVAGMGLATGSETADTGGAPPDDDDALAHLRRRLAAVLVGETLSDELRADAEDAMITARARTEDTLVRTQLRTLLEEMNYEVHSAESASTGLVITSPGLEDAAVHVDLSEQAFEAQVHPGTSGWDSTRTARWRQAWDEITRQLAAAGLAVDVIEPASAKAAGSADHADDVDTEAEDTATSAPATRARYHGRSR
jgi:hypothetical protein